MCFYQVSCVTLLAILVYLGGIQRFTNALIIMKCPLTITVYLIRPVSITMCTSEMMLYTWVQKWCYIHKYRNDAIYAHEYRKSDWNHFFLIILKEWFWVLFGCCCFYLVFCFVLFVVVVVVCFFFVFLCLSFPSFFLSFFLPFFLSFFLTDLSNTERSCCLPCPASWRRPQTPRGQRRRLWHWKGCTTSVKPRSEHWPRF